MPVGRGERGGGSGTCGRLKVGGRTEEVEDVYEVPWSRSCHTHHAARAKECICRLMHCGALTTRQPDRSSAHVFKRANEHAKGHTCDKVWDGLCILWSRSCHMHHAARAKECICRLMHCGAFTTGQPDRSCAHVLKRANKLAKGHTCDNVWDV